MIYYKCVHCSTDLETDNSLGSKTEPCPICGKINTVPKSKQQLKEERRQQQAAEIIKKREEETKKRQAIEETIQEEEKRKIIKANCPHCSRLYDLPEKFSGRKAKCKCGKVFHISTTKHPQTMANFDMPQIKNIADNESKSSPVPQPVYIADPASPPSLLNTVVMPPPSLQPQKNKPTKWIIVALFFIVLIPMYSWFHNSGLRDKLKSCETYGIVKVDVYYDKMFGSDVVVFDLKDGGLYSARRIDPVHLFLQFASKIDLYSVQHIILARNGRHVFYLYADDLRRLTDSYAGDGRIWAFNHLPESCRTMSGSHAYNEWTGGWLVVLQKQAEDLNDFIDTWTGYTH
jgi:hypothetical protein